jgi:hypothetical protein
VEVDIGQVTAPVAVDVRHVLPGLEVVGEGVSKAYSTTADAEGNCSKSLDVTNFKDEKRGKLIRVLIRKLQ